MKLRAAGRSEVFKNALGKQLNISVSSADTWDDCVLKWLFAYYYRVPQEEKESTRTGNGVHDVLETYLKTGEWRFEGKPIGPKHRFRVLAERGLAASGLTVIPGVGVQDGWETEEWTPDDLMCGPLRFKGKIDIHRVVGALVKALEIWDWKTSKNPTASYNPTPTSLGWKRQPLAYGYAMGLKYGLVGQPFTARYIYMATVGDQAFPMDADEPIPWERAEEEWKKLEGIAADMAALAKKAEGKDQASFIHEVPRNTRSCRKYGGCDFAGLCPYSPQNKTNPAFVNPQTLATIDPEKITMGGLQDLANLGALAGVSKTPAAPITPVQTKTDAPAPPPADAEGKTQTLADQLTAMLASPAFAGGIPSSMLPALATGVGVADPAEAIALAGLALVDGKYVRAPQRSLEPASEGPAGVVVPPGTSATKVQELADEHGLAFADLLEQNSLCVVAGLAVTAEDKAEHDAKGGTDGITWLYAKYHGDNDGVAGAVDVAKATAPQTGEAQQSGPPEEPKKPTPKQEIEATITWLEEQDWTVEGMLVTDVLDALKKGPLSHRQRLGATFLDKALKQFNGSNPPVLLVEGAGSKARLKPTELALAAQTEETVAYTNPPPPQASEPEPEQAPASTGQHVGPDLANIAQQLQAAEQKQEVPLGTKAEVPTEPDAILYADAAQVTILVDIYTETGYWASVPLERWAAEYTDQVMEYAKSQNLKGADTGSWQLIEYGKGTGLFDRVFRTCFEKGEVPPSITVDSRSPLASTFLAAARASGKALIFRGGRG